jgi:hypothetical protein
MKMKKNIGSIILLGIGLVLLMCYFGGLFYIYNIQEYNPYASAGADLDALIHCVLFIPPTAICLILSLILHLKQNNNKHCLL